MPRPLADFLGTPSVRVTAVALALWGLYDVACSFGLPGFPGGSVSRAVRRLYVAYPGTAEYAFLAAWVALGLYLSWHFRFHDVG